MSWKRRQFSFREVSAPKGCTGGPTDFPRGIPDDHLPIQSDGDPLPRVTLKIRLAVALIQVIVPRDDTGDERAILRRIVRHPRCDQPPAFTADLLPRDPLLLLLDAHLVRPPSHSILLLSAARVQASLPAQTWMD